MVQIFPSTNLSPYVHLTRDDRVETAVQNWLRQESEKQDANYCFLCSSLIQDSRLPFSASLVAEQIALCKNFLIELDLANYSNEINPESISCQNCIQEVCRVWNLHEEILIIRRQIAEILSRLVQQRKSDSNNPVPLNANHGSEISAFDGAIQFFGREVEATRVAINGPTGNEDIVRSVFTGGPPATLGNDTVSNNLVVTVKVEQPDSEDVLAVEVEPGPAPNVPMFRDPQTCTNYSRPRLKNKNKIKNKKCVHCGKAFSNNTLLSKHTRAFHDKVKYPCSVCGRELTTARRCAAHEAIKCGVVHSPAELKRVGLKLWRCELACCEYVSATEGDLKCHVLTIHKNVFRCSSCDCNYTSSQELAVHEKLCKIVETLKTGSQPIKIETESSPNFYESTESPSSAIDIVQSILVGERIAELRRKSSTSQLNGCTLRENTESSATSSIDIVQSVVVGQRMIAELLRKSSTSQLTVPETRKSEIPNTPRDVPRSRVSLLQRGEMCEELNTYYAQHNLTDYSRAAYYKKKCPCSVCGMWLSSPKDCAAHEVVMCKVAHPPELLEKMDINIVTCPLVGCEELFWRENDLDNHVLTSHKNKQATT
ncbi:zinc finger protein 271 isoform X2 [Folsomia candida]|uniref:zinc finger protein 271 isoform X2 n=1 Tax=Folsomia candida TaxID=158441 RepID=UPI000B907530|nr:zinc finger protein 271 isoform X2 [Folsomia candida]